ncbi:MAG: type IV secretion system protein [Alphaproteobacteria bacterium]|nr:type IV secretion system protein [Alphaproteobacteria bacterium]MBU1516578.1 type IV secretion system protein [Alphaproteobacteria bacterium]MBU2094335.1 type IV secretion system protein [Alphaproteobacteria bacterium]MBU2154088.1 type IV secretion system protein [Alphaproteobacteria bacterium]MBU2307505.1 type IV secretion system protein [Alphaproteobacteria bacterium]
MDGDFRIFAPAYVFIDGKLDQFLSAGASRVIGEVAGPLRVALVLYVLLYGFAILRGAISEPVMDFAVRSVKLALIYFLATSAAYGDWVTQPLFHTLPDTLARAIAGAGSGDAGQAFDQFFSRAAYLGQKAAREANALNWVPLVVSGAVFVIGALAAALGFGIVTLAKVALALLVALGPIFVACSLFEATRRYFFGWLSQAVNYLVLFALIIAVFQLILALVGDRWSAIDGEDPVVGGLIFIALCLLGAIFFLQTPAIAAGIAGGASAGLADFGNAAAMSMSGQAPFRSSGGGGGGRTQVRREGGSVRPVGAKA